MNGICAGGSWAYHVKGGAGGDDGAFVLDVFDADAREADGDDGPEAEGFFDEGGDVGDFFFDEAFFPGVAVGVDFHDFFVSTLLDGLALRGSEISDGHDDVPGNSVKASGYHCETNRFNLGWK